MPEHKLCVPCLFGLEGPLGNELRHMGLRDVMPENGRVRCTGCLLYTSDAADE